MADTTPPSTAKKGGTFGFLSHKLFGKIPVWVVAVAGVGGYYWYTHYGPGKKTAGAMQTDPAGNQCATINPATGYCPGTPADIAANTAAAAAGSTSGDDTTGTGAAAGSTSGGSSGGDGGSGGAGGGGGGDSSGGSTGTYTPPATTGTTPTDPYGTGIDIPVAFPGTTPVSPATVAAYAATQPRTAPTKAPPARQSTITVKPGQTLAQIAAANGISVADLAHANTYTAGEAPGKAAGTTLGTGAGLKTGQTLVVPKASAAKTARSAPVKTPVKTGKK